MNRKTVLLVLCFYALIFSVLKTLRFPNGWSGGHWMLDYRFGFIKRGLGGEIFGWFFEKNEQSVFVLSAAILFLLHTLIFSIAVKEIGKQQNSFYRILFFLIFFLSQYIVFSVHIIGYLDNVVFLTTILVVYLIKKKQIFVPSLIASACMLVHEMTFFLMVPISCFTIIVSGISTEKFSIKEIFSGSTFKKLMFFAAVPFLIMISISVYQETHNEIYFSTIFNYLKQFSFISEQTADSVASAYTKSFTYYFAEEKGHFFQRLFMSTCTVFYGIPVLFLMWMIFREFNLKKNIQLFVILIAISLLPLLLHAVAYDTYRIWTFPFMLLFLGFWILSSKFTTENENMKKLSAFETVFFVVSLLFVTLVPNYLFDHAAERFSLPLRILLISPMFLLLYVLKKPQPK